MTCVMSCAPVRLINMSQIDYLITLSITLQIFLYPITSIDYCSLSQTLTIHTINGSGLRKMTDLHMTVVLDAFSEATSQKFEPSTNMQWAVFNLDKNFIQFFSLAEIIELPQK